MKTTSLFLSHLLVNLIGMTALVLATLLCMGLALAVVALVAVPARREGRDLLTARGEEVVGALRERSDQVRPRRAREAAHG